MFPLVLACALGSGSSPARAVDSDPQEAAITKTAEAFVEAFQKGDAKAVASFWTPDGDYVDPTGRVLNGRPAIEKDFADLFAQNKGLKLRIEVASLKFPTLDTDRTKPPNETNKTLPPEPDVCGRHDGCRTFRQGPGNPDHRHARFRVHENSANRDCGD